MNHLSHLPQEKQNELAEIVKIIREIADPAKGNFKRVNIMLNALKISKSEWGLKQP